MAAQVTGETTMKVVLILQNVVYWLFMLGLAYIFRYSNTYLRVKSVTYLSGKSRLLLVSWPLQSVTGMKQRFVETHVLTQASISCLSRVEPFVHRPVELYCRGVAHCCLSFQLTSRQTT